MRKTCGRMVVRKMWDGGEKTCGVMRKMWEVVRKMCGGWW